MPSRVWNIYEEAMPRWSFRSNLNLLEGQGVEFVFPQGSYEVVKAQPEPKTQPKQG